MVNETSDMAEQLRRAIRASGQSLNQLGQERGVDSGRLSRFMRGERDLTLEATTRLCQVLGLELTGVPRGRPPKATPGTPPAKDLEATENEPRNRANLQRPFEETKTKKPRARPRKE